MIDEKSINVNELPFEEGGAGLYGHKPKASHVSPPRYMSTRASIFLAFAVIGLNIMLMSDVRFYIPFAALLALILFWCISLRFIRKPSVAPVCAAILILLSAGAGYLTSSVILAAGLSVASLGLACMNLMGLDDHEEDVRPAFLKEILIPLFFACAASSCGFLSGYFFEKKYLFMANIISVAFLILVSIAISKTSGSRYFFTSKRLTEFWDIPVAEISQVRIFIFAKCKYVITVLSTFGICLALWYFLDLEFKQYLYLPAAAILNLPLIYLFCGKERERRSLFGTKFLMFEAFLSAILVSLYFAFYSGELRITVTVYAFMLLIGTDIIGSVLLAVIRRRQIFVSRSKYIDGTPFMMTMFSLLIMLVECCL